MCLPSAVYHTHPSLSWVDVSTLKYHYSVTVHFWDCPVPQDPHVVFETTPCYVPVSHWIASLESCSSVQEQEGVLLFNTSSSVTLVLFFMFVNFSVIENRLLIVSGISPCVFVIHDSRLLSIMSGTSVFYSGVVWDFGFGIVISSIKSDLLGIHFTLARVESSGSSSEDPFSPTLSSPICTSSSLSVRVCEYMMGVQVLVMLSNVCVWWTPFSLWLSSIALAPAIIACVFPQKSYGSHFGLSHDGKLQIVSSISLTPPLTLVETSGCWGLIAV